VRKFNAEAQEQAYDLMMVQQMPFTTVVKRMREIYGKFAAGTLSKWKNDTALDWEGRYRKYCEELAAKNDKLRVKEITPMISAIQEIRENIFKQLVTVFEEGNKKITTKNLGSVLLAFTKLADLEYRMSGRGKGNQEPIQKVVNMIFMVLENNPNIRPVIQAHKHELVEAITMQIEDGA